MQINSKISQFIIDFAKKVHPIFVKNNWKWANIFTGQMYMPLEQDIIDWTHDLVRNTQTVITSGRIKSSFVENNTKLRLCIVEKYGDSANGDIDGFECFLNLTEDIQQNNTTQNTKRWQDAWYERYD